MNIKVMIAGVVLGLGSLWIGCYLTTEVVSGTWMALPTLITCCLSMVLGIFVWAHGVVYK